MIDIQEIREGIQNIVDELLVYSLRIVLNGGDDTSREKSYAIAQILSYLAEKGACFPVEEELPSINLDDYEWRDFHSIINVTRRVMLEANYKKVITLKEMMGGENEDLVEDGFGTSASAICPLCGCRAVYVCRPGDIRCGVCYDGNPKEFYTGIECPECTMLAVHNGVCLCCKEIMDADK